jgi:hypothetical protein
MKQQILTQKRPPGISTVLMSFLAVLMLAIMPMLSWAQGSDIEQGENGNWSVPVSPMNWITGNLNHNNSHYAEDQAVPYRLVLTGMPTDGTPVRICLSYALVNSGKIAFDFLTTYDCLDPHNYINHTTPELVVPAPGTRTAFKQVNAPIYLSYPFFSGANNKFNNVIPLGKRQISIWGAAFTADPIEYVYFDSKNLNSPIDVANLPAAIADALANNGSIYCKWIIRFVPSSANVTMAWGGHISDKQDYGYPPAIYTACGISGSSYHMSADFWDLNNDGEFDPGFGSRDLSLQAAAVVPTPICPEEIGLSLCYNQNTQTNYATGQCPAACAPATLYFSAPASTLANTYEWSVSPTATIVDPITNQTVGITFATPGTYTVTVKLRNVDQSGGSSQTVVCTVVVTLDAPATCNISGDIDLCLGDNTVLTASGGTTYTWKDGQGNVVGNQATLTLNGLPVGNHSYSVEVGNGNACGPTICGTSVLVRPLPTITLDPAGPFCIDAPAFQLNYGPKAPGIGIFNTLTGLSQTGLFTPAIAGVNTNPGHGVTYTYTDEHGCVNAKSIDIIVNPLPIVSVNPAGPFCIDAPAFQMSANPAGGVYSGNGVSATGMFNPATAGAGQHLITYTYSDANTCTNFATTTVVVNPLPVVTLNPAGPFCLLDNAYQLVGNPAGGTYSGPGVSSAGMFTPLTAGVGTHTITYTYSDVNTCVNTATTDIVVNPMPVCNISGETLVCNNTGNHYYTGPANMATYSWSISGNGTIPGAKDGMEVNVSAGAAGTFTLSLTVTNSFGCSTTCTFEVDVTAICEPACTYTQGYYGNPGGLSCPGNPPLNTTQAAMVMAFTNYGANMVTFGKLSANRYFNLYLSDINGNPTLAANNIFRMLPGGGQAKAIDMWTGGEIKYDNMNSWKYVPLDTRKNTSGKIMNGLLAQTIALWFNLQNNGILDDIVLPYDVLLVAPASCGNNAPTGPAMEYTLPHTVVQYLNSGGAYGNTVTDLFNLANAYLGGETPGDLSPIDVANAVDIINNAFDECGVLMGYKQGEQYLFLQAPRLITANMVPAAAVVEQQPVTELTVRTFPNPYTDVVRFEIRSATGGQGELGIYNMQGMRIASATMGQVPAGQVFIYEYRMPVAPVQMLMYKMNIGNQQVTGKLLRVVN